LGAAAGSHAPCNTHHAFPEDQRLRAAVAVASGELAAELNRTPSMERRAARRRHKLMDDRRCPDRADQRAPCQVGPAVEITLKYLPWRSFPGKVETILQAVSGSQTQVSGQAARLDDFYLV
jgi:hypothetical protein